MKSCIKLAIVSICILIASSCHTDLTETTSCLQVQDEEKVVVFDREQNLPLPKITIDTGILTRATPTNRGNTDALLGYGYKLLNGTYIMGDFNNVTFPVVNLEAIRQYDPTYIGGNRLNTVQTKIFAYDTFERYQYTSTVSKKVSSGFSFSFKLFSIGRKKATTETFKTVIDKLEESTFGELSLDFVSDHFSLQHSEGARKLFSRQFLTRSFIRSLYGSPIQSTLDNYGEFVLTEYLTGGKAYAVYAGHNSKYSTSSERESGITKSINASLTYKGATASGQLGFSSSDSKKEENDFQNSNTFIYIKTFGGNRNGSEAEVKARTLDGLNVNLTPWLNSLNVEENNTIIDVSDNSLFPLSAFVLEKNFKQRLDDTTNGILPSFKTFVIPYIEIDRVMVRSTPSYEPLYEVAPVLVTRQGDRVIFMTDNSASSSDEELKKNNDNNHFLQKVKQLSANRHKLFSDKLELSYNKKARLNPALRTPLCLVLNKFNKEDFYRYYYPKTGIMYIYAPKTHIAFSCYMDEDDDDVLDVYGIREWVENLPEKKTSIASLASHYYIIGL